MSRRDAYDRWWWAVQRERALMVLLGLLVGALATWLVLA